MDSYLIKLYYMDKKINKYEYQVQETIFFGEDNTINDKILEYVKRLKENFNFNVEQYSIYKHFNSELIEKVV